MRTSRLIVALVSLALLSGCALRTQARDSVQALNRTEAVGSPFTKSLTSEYRGYANLLGVSFSTNKYTAYFARKGAAAADGMIVMPETPDNWRLSTGDIMDIGKTRPLLLQALDNGGRERAPEKAARAQALFDCWVVEKARRQRFGKTNCKPAFDAAMNDLLTALEDQVTPDSPESPFYNSAADNMLMGADGTPVEIFPSPIAAVGAGEKGALAPVKQAMFIVFFDWNQTVLTQSANDVLDAIANELKARADVKRVISIGHADTSGPSGYNERLSLARANAVRDALIARGVSANSLNVEGRGENDLLVPTPDNVREPGNRRAQITLE